jgi:hypothetical protein
MLQEIQTLRERIFKLEGSIEPSFPGHSNTIQQSQIEDFEKAIQTLAKELGTKASMQDILVLMDQMQGQRESDLFQQV